MFLNLGSQEPPRGSTNVDLLEALVSKEINGISLHLPHTIRRLNDSHFHHSRTEPFIMEKDHLEQMVTFSIFGLGPAVMKICHRELGGGKDFVVLAF